MLIKPIKSLLGLLTANKISRMYSLKYMKIVLLVFAIFILSIAIAYFVYDIGVNSSYYGYSHIDSVVKIISDNNTESAGTLGTLLIYFADRRNAVIIYYIMLALLVVFDLIVIKRIIYIWKCYKEREKIDKILINKSKSKITELKDLLKNTERQIGGNFVYTLLSSFENEGTKTYFSQFYNSFINKEEDNTQSFYIGSNRSGNGIIESYDKFGNKSNR